MLASLGVVVTPLAVGNIQVLQDPSDLHLLTLLVHFRLLQ